ncbi:unnamed protein product [Notodromas monacha]|uniref:RRM domain-containing protein n=1 Tax=Notodromas monacha TaxID=399045 RepID=A0A7R9GBF7_9CRUS|nr:unnamed protein product [Notodromas monacha]CAG0915023.1 unnamed protein product [Notodromas monacha]
MAHKYTSRRADKQTSVLQMGSNVSANQAVHVNDNTKYSRSENPVDLLDLENLSLRERGGAQASFSVNAAAAGCLKTRTVFAATIIECKNVFGHILPDTIADRFMHFGQVLEVECDELYKPTKLYSNDPYLNVDETVSEQELLKYCSSQLLRNVYVRFASVGAAVSAVDTLARIGCHTRRLLDPREMDSFSVYLCNLPKMMTKEQLADMVSAVGEVLLSWIVGQNSSGDANVTNKECSCGFVRMRKAADCVTAVRHFHGMRLPGSPFPLVVRLGHKRKFVNRPTRFSCTHRPAVITYGKVVRQLNPLWDAIFFFPPDISLKKDEKPCFTTQPKSGGNQRYVMLPTNAMIRFNHQLLGSCCSYIQYASSSDLNKDSSMLQGEKSGKETRGTSANSPYVSNPFYGMTFLEESTHISPYPNPWNEPMPFPTQTEDDLPNPAPNYDQLEELASEVQWDVVR